MSDQRNGHDRHQGEDEYRLATECGHCGDWVLRGQMRHHIRDNHTQVWQYYQSRQPQGSHHNRDFRQSGSSDRDGRPRLSSTTSNGDRPCMVCGEIQSRGNLKRHVKRIHPVEYVDLYEKDTFSRATDRDSSTSSADRTSSSQSTSRRDRSPRSRTPSNRKPYHVSRKEGNSSSSSQSSARKTPKRKREESDSASSSQTSAVTSAKSSSNSTTPSSSSTESKSSSGRSKSTVSSKKRTSREKKSSSGSSSSATTSSSEGKTSSSDQSSTTSMGGSSSTSSSKSARKGKSSAPEKESRAETTKSKNTTKTKENTAPASSGAGSSRSSGPVPTKEPPKKKQRKETPTTASSSTETVTTERGKEAKVTTASDVFDVDSNLNPSVVLSPIWIGANPYDDSDLDSETYRAITAKHDVQVGYAQRTYETTDSSSIRLTATADESSSGAISTGLSEQAEVTNITVPSADATRDVLVPGPATSVSGTTVMESASSQLDNQVTTPSEILTSDVIELDSTEVEPAEVEIVTHPQETNDSTEASLELTSHETIVRVVNASTANEPVVTVPATPAPRQSTERPATETIVRVSRNEIREIASRDYLTEDIVRRVRRVISERTIYEVDPE